MGALGFGPGDEGGSPVGSHRPSFVIKVISTLCRGNVQCIESMESALGFGLLGVMNPWSPQAIALKARVNNPKTPATEPRPPLKSVEDTRRPPTWEDSIDPQWKAILDALAGVARGSIIPDTGIGPIVDPRVIVPQGPQVPQGGVY